MKHWIFAALLLPALAGCALMSNGYIEPVDYDLPVARETLPGIDVRIGVFRNLSGSDRRFLYRETGDRMLTDEYNRWLQSPDMMLERDLRSAFAADVTSDGNNFTRLEGTIYRFEFDRARKMAVLGVDYSAKVYHDKRPAATRNFNAFFEQPIKGDTPEAAVKAMAQCMAQSVTAARKLLEEVNQ